MNLIPVSRLAYEQFQKALIAARHQSGMTQSELADRLKRPQSFVSKYESGERRLDVIEFLAVCSAIQTDPAQILKKLRGENDKSIDDR